MLKNRVIMDISFNLIHVFFGLFLPVMLFILLCNNCPNPVLSNSERVMVSIFLLGWGSLYFAMKAMIGLMMISQKHETCMDVKEELK